VAYVDVDIDVDMDIVVLYCGVVLLRDNNLSCCFIRQLCQHRPSLPL